MKTLKIKSIAFLSAIAIILLCFACVCFTSFAYDNSDKVISEEEKSVLLNEVNSLESSGGRPIAVYGIGEKTEKRSLILRDFDEEKAYIYMEMEPSGYAIFDRTGEFIYERTESGEGPYANYGANDLLYYGGPQG